MIRSLGFAILLGAFLGIAACGSGNSAAPPTDAGPVMSAEAGDAQISMDVKFVAGQPITAPASQWTWVAFPDAFCGNGTTTGLGINLGAPGSRVLLYLEGGGACWNELTCYSLMTASNFTTGYSETNFTNDVGSAHSLAEPGSFFDRTSASNPFKDYSYVYVPYCTGDIFAGNNVVQYGTNTAMHVGFRNINAYLERLVPTFTGADRVILAGSSAGGYGAVYNWWQTQKAFGKIRVDMIDDSGTFPPADVLAKGNGADKIEASQWNVISTLPPGCTGCVGTGLDALFGFYANAFPTQRGALLSYTKDTVLPTFIGVSTGVFTMGLDEDLMNQIVPNPSLRSFVVDASGHVLWFKPTLTTGGVTLEQFITQMVTDDPAWMSAGP